MAASSSLSRKLNDATTMAVPGARGGGAAACAPPAQQVRRPSAAAAASSARRHHKPRVTITSAPQPGRSARGGNHAAAPTLTHPYHETTTSRKHTGTERTVATRAPVTIASAGSEALPGQEIVLAMKPPARSDERS